MKKHLLLLFLIFSIKTLFALEIGGVLDSDLTLYSSDNPHIVTGILSVPEGVTLNITQGVELYFQHETYLQVAGTIRALGSADNEILMTRQNEEDFWGGIVLFDIATDYDQETDAGCKFDYCHIQEVHYTVNVTDILYTGWGIASENTSFYVDHSHAEGSAFFTLFSGAIIKNSILERSGYVSLCPNLETSVFQGNEVFNCGGLMAILDIPGGIITDNIFHDNAFPTIVLNITNASSTISNNHFYNNTGAAVAINGGQNHTITNNTFESNDINFLMRCERTMIFTENCFISFNDWNIYLDGGIFEFLPVGGCDCVNFLTPADIDFSNNYFGALTDSEIALSIYDADDSISQEEPFSAIFSPQSQDANCFETSVENFTSIGNERQIAYPNPCDNEVYFSSPRIGESYSLIDVNGKTIKTGQIQRSVNLIDTRELSEGLYIMRIQNNVTRFVVKH